MNWQKVIAAMDKRADELSKKSNEATESGDKDR